MEANIDGIKNLGSMVQLVDPSLKTFVNIGQALQDLRAYVSDTAVMLVGNKSIIVYAMLACFSPIIHGIYSGTPH